MEGGAGDLSFSSVSAVACTRVLHPRRLYVRMQLRGNVYVYVCVRLPAFLPGFA